MNKEVDQILQWGVSVPYVHSESPEELVVLKPWVFWSARLQKTITVGEWFVYDGASIPRALRSVVTKAGHIKIPAIVHDALYCLPAIGGTAAVSRKQSDEVLYDFCLQQNMPKWRAWLVYAAVRSAGWLRYSRKEKRIWCPENQKSFYKDSYSYLQLSDGNGRVSVE
jgi:hypothetical protein